MQSPGREPSMEDILASIKKVIAEEKELRAVAAGRRRAGAAPTTSLELDETTCSSSTEPLAPPLDLGPPLLDEDAAETSRQALDDAVDRRRQRARRRRRSTRSRRWSATCSARSSSNGSTIICPASSTSMSSARSRRITGRPRLARRRTVDAALQRPG